MSRNSPLTVTLSAHALYQASLFQARERTARLALRGVYLEPTPAGVFAVGTDETTLGVAFSPATDDAPVPDLGDVVLAVDTTLRAALRKVSADQAQVVFDPDRRNATVTITYTGGRLAARAFRAMVVRDRFPPWLGRVRLATSRLILAAPGAKMLPLAAGDAAVWEKVSVRHGRRAQIRLYMPAAYGSERVPLGLMKHPIIVRVAGEAHFLGLVWPAASTWDPLASPVPEWLPAEEARQA